MADVELNPGGASDLNEALRLRTGFTTARQAVLDGLAAVATSGSAADLGAGILPAARFNDTTHGTRGGGTLHADAVAGGAAGFMSGSDKDNLDKLGIRVFARMAADYTLTSTTSAQKIFDSSISTNGEVALTTGLWEFVAFLYLTGMSATTGNAAFSLPVSTAVLSHIFMQGTGIDNDNPFVSGAIGGNHSISGSVNLGTTQTGTGIASAVRGMFRVTTAGLVIPSIALATAAAATLKAGTCFMARRIGDDSVTLGTWS